MSFSTTSLDSVPYQAKEEQTEAIAKKGYLKGRKITGGGCGSAAATVALVALTTFALLGMIFCALAVPFTFGLSLIPFIMLHGFIVCHCR